MLRLLGIYVLATLVFMQCNPHGKMLRLADAASQREDYDEAAKYYYNVLLQQPKNDKARAGLQFSGQKILTAKFASFSKLVIANRIKEAIEQYQYAEQFYRNAKNAGVHLDWPQEYHEVYEDISVEYASQLFDEALVLMNQKKFDQAENKFTQIAQFDTSFRGISVLRINTVYESLYQKATQLMQTSRYKESYAMWNRLLALNPDYKDAAAMSELAKSKATLSLGIFPIQTKAKDEDAEGFIRTVEKQVTKSNTAYLQVVGPDAIKQQLASRGWGTLENTNQLMEAAKSSGLSYVMWIELLGKTDTVYETKSVPTTAYEAVSENILNPYTGTYTYITKFKKVNLTDSYRGIHLAYTFRVNLIDVAAQKILHQDEFVLERKDQAHKINYTGKPENLYPELPKGNYLPPVSDEWKERFATTQRDLIPKATLQSEIEKELAKRISFIINRHIK